MPKTRDPHAGATGRNQASGPAGRSRHDWIADQLKRVYDEALVEDIPSDMLELLEQLDRSDRRQKPGNEDKDGS